MYTVYYSPTDYPGEYVVRRFYIVGPDPVPDKDLFLRTNSFHIVRAKMENEMGKIFFHRSPGDDPVIVGTYM